MSHPGRARLHGFGIFGGSNGYWRTELLRADADARLHADRGHRLVDAGARRGGGDRLGPGPHLAQSSRPTRSAPSGTSGCAGRRAGSRCRCGTCAPHAQASRRLAPQPHRRLLPACLARGLPVVLAADVPDASPSGCLAAATDRLVRSRLRRDDAVHPDRRPVQALFAWKLADPSVKAHRRWFVLFLFALGSSTRSCKNVIVRTAQLKELMGEQAWKVTPRAARPVAASPPDGVERRSPSSVGAPLRGDEAAAAPSREATAATALRESM